MRKRPSGKSIIAAKASSEKKYCCVTGVCVRVKPREEPVCVEGGGFMVGSCSHCKWHAHVRDGDKPPSVAL